VAIVTICFAKIRSLARGYILKDSFVALGIDDWSLER
jgi:hypothetical protein